MKLTSNMAAPDFNAFTSERMPFTLGRLKGSKIILGFYRNGSCPLSNLRFSLLKKYAQELKANNVHIVAVFESMPRDILPFAGRSATPYFVLADPMALMYDLYQVENSEASIKQAIITGAYPRAIAEAGQQGFNTERQPGSNFYRLPAEFLIDENFIVRKAHYHTSVTDWLSLHLVKSWARDELFFTEKIDAFSTIFFNSN